MRKARLPQSPRHILVFDEDWEYLESRFGINGIKPLGVSNVIRALIHQRVVNWRDAENKAGELNESDHTGVTNSEYVK